jgi:flagellar biosynthetic protein FliS
MYPQQRELSYRRSAAAGASWIGLTIALYDTITGNLRRAAKAIREGKIEARCNEVNHALLVLGQLENMMAMQGKDDLSDSLSMFYSVVRMKMMEASIKQSATLMEAQIELILQVRTAWQQRDTAVAPVPAGMLAAANPYAERASSSFSQSV